MAKATRPINVWSDAAKSFESAARRLRTVAEDPTSSDTLGRLIAIMAEADEALKILNNQPAIQAIQSLAKVVAAPTAPVVVPPTPAPVVETPTATPTTSDKVTEPVKVADPKPAKMTGPKVVKA